MSSVVLLLLVLTSHLVLSYNIDIDRPTIFKDPGYHRSDYFGYSVSLRRSRTANSSYSLFVGAPEYSHGTGRMYRCSESQCQPFHVIDERGPKHGWLGASMAAGEFSDLTVCAPRSLYAFTYVKNVPIELIGGICYDVRDDFPNVRPIGDGSTPIYGYSMIHGFSVSYVPTKNAASNLRTTRIIGRPGVPAVVIGKGGNGWTERFNQLNINLGYSVTSGYYFGSANTLLYAVGAPAWSRKGMVVIFEQHALNGGARLIGSVLGEYFGASLGTGDFDGDGRDDLAVGAPHWGDVDFGRVYIYQSSTGWIQLGRTLQGNVGNAQFGYTLAAADLDRDGYSDLIISAPWENSGAGAVYIYYGHRDFNKKNPSAQIIQRIEPSAFKRSDVKRFGFSFSQPVDIDGNGYPDLAIGAYESGHAVVLHGRPVITTMIELSSHPGTLQTNASEFTVRVCVTYHGKWAPDSQDLSFDMTVDARFNRAVNGPMQKLDGTFQLGTHICKNKKIPLTPHKNRNNVDPIMIDVTHSIKEGVNQGKIDAVLDRRSSRNRVSLTVPINTNCRNFTACNAELYVDAKFGKLREENVWVVGSGDISLDLAVRNDDEPAYDTQVTIGMPVPRISLRNQIEFCKTAPDTLSLTCDVGNPLVGGRPISFKVHLDMSSIDTRSVGDSVLVFNVTKSTRSNDKKATQPIPPLKLEIKHDANVDLTGVTDKKRLHYRRMVEDAKIPVKHFYKVLKSGPSPITEAYLNIDVPTSMFEKNVSFLNISDWKLPDSSGTVDNCFISDARSVDHLLRLKRFDDSGDSDGTLVIPGSPATNETRNPDDEVSHDSDNEEEIVGDLTTGRTIFLNCSTEGVSCTRLTCRIGLSKTGTAIRSVNLDMTFNATSFYASDEGSVNIKFHTNASVDIKWPLISNSRDTRNWRSNATTVLYSIPEPKKLAGWIIPVSIILGILLLCVVAAVMYKAGFFKRSEKLKTEKAKDKELILNANNADNIEYVNPDVNAIGDDNGGP